MLARSLSLIALFSISFGLQSAYGANNLISLTISVPGPHNLSYLPIDLIPKIGADRAEGATVNIRHTGGGGVAIQDLVHRNSDFAVAGAPAILSQKAKSEPVTILAAVDDMPLFVLMVRSDLKGEVKRVADLKGRVIGVNTSSMSSKSTSQQLVELLLKAEKVETDMVRMVPAGQSWEQQSAILISSTADAVMGDEPFASRLLAMKKVFFLVNLAEPAAGERIPGAGFLHAALATRPDVLQEHPRKVEKMVSILRRTLQWIATHTPEQFVAALDIKDQEERKALLQALRKYHRLYSPDARLSTKQLHETEVFFRAAEQDNPAALKLTIESMVTDKWAGRKE